MTTKINNVNLGRPKGRGAQNLWIREQLLLQGYHPAQLDDSRINAMLHKHVFSQRRERRKRRNVHILKVDISRGVAGLDGALHCPAQVIATSECRWVRKLNPGLSDNAAISDQLYVGFDSNEDSCGLNNTAAIYKGIAISSVSPLTGRDEDIERAKQLEAEVKGKRYFFFIQSASQERQMEATFMAFDPKQDLEEQWEDALRKILGGVLPSGEVVLSRTQSYCALSQSSSLCPWDDPENPWTDKVKVRVVPDLEIGGLCRTDGAGLMDPKLGIRLAEWMGLSYLPTAWQGRGNPGGLKGVWHLGYNVDWEKEGVDMIATESQAKLMGVGEVEIEFEICSYSKPMTGWTTMNYQFIQSLNIKAEDLIALADRQFEAALKALESPEDAMAFLGMIGSSDYEETLVSRLTRALDANPKALKDPWVRGQLIKTIQTSLYDMRLGRIAVRGDILIVAPELNAIGGTKEDLLLKEGEAYMAGLEGEAWINLKTREVSLFRSPNLHRSEVVKVKLVSSPELEAAYGRNYGVLMVNCLDDIAPRMQGMDFDGDTVKVITEPVIQAAVEEGLPLSQEEGLDAKKTEWSYDNLRHYLATNMSTSIVGIATDMATTWVDLYRSVTDPDLKEEIDRTVIELKNVVGRAIDSAKTGEVVEIPYELQIDKRPHWLEKKESVTYHSISPMGQLYDHVKSRIKDLDNVKMATRDSHKQDVINIVLAADFAQVMAVNNVVAEYYHRYNKEVGVLFGRLPKNLSEEERAERTKEPMNEIIERYSAIMNTISRKYGAKNVAAASYHLAYVSNSRDVGISFPWLCCFEGMVELLSSLSNDRYVFTRAHFVRGAKVTPTVGVTDYIVCNNHGQAIGVAKLPNGAYKTREFQGQHYILVERPKYEADLGEEEAYQVVVATGGRSHVNKALMDLEGDTCKFVLGHVGGIKKIGIMKGDKLCGTLVNESILEGAFLLKEEMEVTRVVPVAKTMRSFTVTIKRRSK